MESEKKTEALVQTPKNRRISTCVRNQRNGQIDEFQLKIRI